MKLTVKVEAKGKVEAFVRDCEDYGRINRPFDTRDFVELENAVILSAREAKQIFKIIEDFAPISYWAKYEKAIEKLANQIEQAEGKE